MLNFTKLPDGTAGENNMVKCQIRCFEKRKDLWKKAKFKTHKKIIIKQYIEFGMDYMNTLGYVYSL